jgi:hypothetical protein
MLSTYEPIEPSAIPVLPMYIIIASFASIITILLFIKWRERQRKPALLLFLTFMCYTIAILGLTIGFGEAIFTGEKRELYRFSLAFGYFMVMIANCFLIIFATDVFGVKKELGYKYIILSLIVAVMVALPQNYYGIPETEVGSDSIRIYSSTAMMLLSIVIYTRIYLLAMKVANSAQEKVAQVGFRYIGFSQLFMILFFICLLLDTLVFTLFNTPGYTVFVYFGWISAAIFMFLSYGGIIMPNWLKKRYNIA